MHDVVPMISPDRKCLDCPIRHRADCSLCEPEEFDVLERIAATPRAAVNIRSLGDEAGWTMQLPVTRERMAGYLGTTLERADRCRRSGARARSTCPRRGR